MPRTTFNSSLSAESIEAAARDLSLISVFKRSNQPHLEYIAQKDAEEDELSIALSKHLGTFVELYRSISGPNSYATFETTIGKLMLKCIPAGHLFDLSSFNVALEKVSI